MEQRLILSCEHGGNNIPSSYINLFRNAEDALRSHRGWDPGALQLAKKIEAKTDVRLHFTEISRLLVEANRSLHNLQLFSEYTSDLPAQEKKYILDTWYRPYRAGLEEEIRSNRENGISTLHISIHTFTPVLNGEIRDADIGLLFDTTRPEEASFCKALAEKINRADSNLHIRENYPYQGTDDGFTTYLRNKYSAKWYWGIEIEVNQHFPQNAESESWDKVQNIIASAIESLVPCRKNSTV